MRLVRASRERRPHRRCLPEIERSQIHLPLRQNMHRQHSLPFRQMNLRNPRRQKAIEELRNSAVPLPEGYRFNREELYDRFDRSVLGRSLALAASESSDEDQGAQ